MIPVKTIMTAEVITVSPQTPIHDALNMLTTNAISGMPVVDDAQKLVGILTEKDVLQILLNGKVSPNAVVADYMSRDVVSFKEDDSAVAVCEFFVKNPMRRVPIVRDGRVVGIVSRRDIVSLIMEAKSKLSNFRYA